MTLINLAKEFPLVITRGTENRYTSNKLLLINWPNNKKSKIKKKTLLLKINKMINVLKRIKLQNHKKIFYDNSNVYLAKSCLLYTSRCV